MNVTQGKSTGGNMEDGSKKPILLEIYTLGVQYSYYKGIVRTLKSHS